jgi:hypothetical protein
MPAVINNRNSSSNYSQNTNGYSLTFEELGDDSLPVPTDILHLRPEQASSFYERMTLSSICTDEETSFHVQSQPLSASIHAMILYFNTCVEENRVYFDYDLDENTNDDRNDRLMRSILDFALGSIEKAIQLAASPYQNTNLNFIVKHVSGLLEDINHMSNAKFMLSWYRTPDTALTFFAEGDLHVGCGLIKYIDAPGSEECRRLLPEKLKRLLHKRLKMATHQDELVTFGMLILGKEMELSVMQLVEDKYIYQVVKRLNLPTMPDTYESMQETVECLLGFFGEISKTVRVHNPNDQTLYSTYKPILKPTLSFI